LRLSVLAAKGLWPGKRQALAEFRSGQNYIVASGLILLGLFQVFPHANPPQVVLVLHLIMLECPLVLAFLLDSEGIAVAFGERLG